MFFTYAKSAISTANAIRVISAAKNETRDATSVTVVCVEKERRNATKVAAVATGWMARPRVQELPMVTSLEAPWTVTWYATPVQNESVDVRQVRERDAHT